jgi:hypothetical protein
VYRGRAGGRVVGMAYLPAKADPAWIRRSLSKVVDFLVAKIQFCQNKFEPTRLFPLVSALPSLQKSLAPQRGA